MRYFNEDARSDHNKLVDWSKWAETTFSPTKAWMVQRHKQLNDTYFGGKLTTPDLQAIKLDSQNGHRTFGWWWVHDAPKQYERDRKGRIIPSTVGKWETKIELALNIMFKGDDFFWESILLHEMCHQAVSELSDPEELEEVKKKDKTEGHHRLWLEWADKVTMDKKHVVTRFSDCKQEAMMLAYLPDTKINLIVFESGGKTGICTVLPRFREGVISNIMTTIFPEKLWVYETSDPMFMSLRQSHRAIDYKVKDSKAKEYIEDLCVISGNDNVFYYEYQAIKDTPFVKLLATEADYAKPEYNWIVWTFESEQKAICKMPPSAFTAWKGMIELDTEDDNSIMKCQITMLDFGSYKPSSRSTVRIKKMETIKTYGAPKEFIQLPYVKVRAGKDSYGRPMNDISVYACQDDVVEKFVNEWSGVVDPELDEKYYTKPGKKYAERAEEQWGVVLWRNEGVDEWNGWTVRAIHLNKIINCIKLTQNVEEGISLLFSNEKDLDYFNAYTELPQLRNYNVSTQNKDMLNISEWAFDSVPGTTSMKDINAALSVSTILERTEFHSNIPANKKRYEQWAKERKYCVVWHDRKGQEYFTPTLETHIKHLTQLLSKAKDEIYKPIGGATFYAIPNTAMIELTKVGANRAVVKEYFKHIVSSPSHDESKADYFSDKCEEYEIDADEEMTDTAEHWWADHISKPYSGAGLWKEISSEAVEGCVIDTLCGVALSDKGVAYIKSVGEPVENVKF